MLAAELGGATEVMPPLGAGAADVRSVEVAVSVKLPVEVTYTPVKVATPFTAVCVQPAGHTSVPPMTDSVTEALEPGTVCGGSCPSCTRTVTLNGVPGA